MEIRTSSENDLRDPVLVIKAEFKDTSMNLQTNYYYWGPEGELLIIESLFIFIVQFPLAQLCNKVHLRVQSGPYI